MSVAAPRVEYKTVTLDRKAAETAATIGEFEGYASTWDVDEGGERIVPGAFKASLARRRHRPLLWNHDLGSVVGVEIALREDTRGLRGRWKFADTEQGRDARTLVRSGSVTSMSIGFIPLRAQKGQDDARELTECDLLECSLVSLPMNTAAMIESFKSSGGAMATHLADFDQIGARLAGKGIIELSRRHESLGARVAADPAMRELKAGRVSSARIRLSSLDVKALVSGWPATIELRDEAPAAGAKVPSVLSSLPQIQTEAGLIQVPRSSGGSGAAAVGPATATTGATGTKPEIVTSYAGDTVAMVPVAGHLVATTRVLDDSAQFARILDTDLRQAVVDALEAEVLNGSGTAPSMRGIANTAGIGTVAATAGQDVAALVEAIGLVVTASRLTPTLIAINATSWAATLEALSGPAFAEILRRYAIALVPTAGLPSGTALVGSGPTAPVYYQSGVTVESGHVGNMFVRNLVMLRGEVSAVVGISKPAAWVKVSGLSTGA